MRNARLLLFVSILFSVFQSYAAGPTPIQVRFTAAYFRTEVETLPPEQSDHKSYALQAAFDLVFQGVFNDNGPNYDLFDASFRTGKLLYAAGQVEFKSDSGANDCAGTFTPDPGVVIFLGTDSVVQNGPLKTLRIRNPATYGNTLTTALLQDTSKNPGRFSGLCRVPGSMPFATGGNPQYSFSPKEQLWKGDEDPLSQAVTRMGAAVVRFDVRSLPITIPVTFYGEESGNDGSKTTSWFGLVEIKRSVDESFAPIDPFTLGGYVPPKLGEKPAAPPVNPSAGVQGISPEEWRRWLREILGNSLPVFQNVANQYRSIRRTGVPFVGNVTGGGTGSFDPQSSTFTFENVNLASLGDGRVELFLTLKKKAKARRYQPTVPPGASTGTLAAGTLPSYSLVLDKAARRALKTKLPYTGFLVGKVTPASGDTAYTEFVQFTVPKRR